MKQSRRPIHVASCLRTVLTTVTVAILAACGDSTSAPSASPALVADQPSAAMGLSTTTFTYNPATGGTFLVGTNKVVFEAGSVCDPATSTYGVGTWDKPCTAAARPITITATTSIVPTTTGVGSTLIEFQPKLRFVPSRRVTLYMNNLSMGVTTLGGPMSIFYCPDGGRCIDESLTDSTLKTYRTPKGQLYRRIKHFSGYMVFADCDQSDPSCTPSGNLLGGLLGGLLNPLTAVKRNTALPSDITTSATIGSTGGTLSIPAAGLTVTVPAGAVSAPTNFSVTARHGSIVAYAFEPHGLQFSKPLVVTQSKSGLSLLGNLLGGMKAGYYANDSDINDAAGTAIVGELLNLGGLLSSNVSFNVWHFSGYLLVSDSE